MSSNKMQLNPKKRGLRIFRFNEQEIVIGKNKTEKSKKRIVLHSPTHERFESMYLKMNLESHL